MALTAGLALLLTGTVQTTAATAATPTTGSPIGNVDVVAAVTGGVQIKGWAWDPDTTSSVAVVVTAGGVTKQTTANTQRNDVGTAFPPAGSYRGFNVTVPTAAGTHNVCVTAKNVGAGSDKVWSCRSITVGTTAAPAPTGTPGPGNTGVPAGTALRVHNGDLTITTPGTVVSGLDIRGYLRIKASDVTVKNSVIRGSAGLTGPMSLIQSSSPRVQIIDTELNPIQPSYFLDGFVGSNITFTRVNIHHVVDSIKIIGSNVTVQDSWLHDNSYYSWTPSGGDTHTDNVQIQIGNNIIIRNNTIAHSRNAAVMITQDRGDVSNVTFSGNRADGGACTINVAEKAYGPINGLKVTGNTFGLNTRISRCAVLLPDTTRSISTVTSNVFTDGTAVTVSRG